MTKRICLILAFVLAIAVFTPIAYWYYNNSGDGSDTPIFFGVSFGGETVSEAKLLIDKVKNYTNLFLVNSNSISTNETALNEVCEYAGKADLYFMVYFSYISRVVYPWHQEWLDSAEERWRDNFLGVYLFDEPGGSQIDTGRWNEEMNEEIGTLFQNVSDYSDAANTYVNSISSIESVLDLKRRDISMFTSDYALYWFDYLAGYNAVFAELAWNHSRPQQIGLCRGAANVQGKDWGAIITWTYDKPPFLANGTEILQDMLIAYEAGAKYIAVFNYPVYPENNPYGILSDEYDHFWALQTFWRYVHENTGDYGKTKGQVAFVLPKDYGWGMRGPSDSIWGLWSAAADNQSSVIWDKMNKLIENYGFNLDIIYEDSAYNYLDDYAEVYYWYSDIN
jgi:hypothetical protein